MPILVQKYGGSSVADVAKIKAVARKIGERRAQGYELVVIVSAMGGTTDALLRLSREVTENPQKRELDMLLTTGERTTMALLSMALNDLGIPAISFTGSQSGIITNESHANAQIIDVRPYRVRDELDSGRVVIIAGFQGVSYKREVTTLGRGGSDTTAVAMAAALGAESCEIYSDVDGVFSGDPRVVGQARKLREIDYEEMQAMSESGAKVLNAQAVEFARKAGIPIDALSTFTAGSGTRVTRLASGEKRVVGIAGQKRIVQMSLRAPPERAVEFLELLDARGIEGVDLAMRREAWSLCIPLDNVHGFGALEEALRQRFGEAIEVEQGLGRVSAIGAGVAADFGGVRLGLDALSRRGIRARGVHSDKNRVAFSVAEQDVDEGVRALHEALIERI